ncbi:MAG: WbqC family protein [Bacteroidota bacterium]
MKKIAILQSNYIPWKGYFDIIKMADVFVFYDEVQYTKNDWRNRNQIKTPTGLSWLTIPVLQNTLNQKINETIVSQFNWNKKHWNSITYNYSKAPFFKTLENEFEQLYSSIETKNLSEINQNFIKKIANYLKIETDIIDSTTLNLAGDKNERLIEAVKKLNGTHYISGPSAKSYLDVKKFEAESIQVEWVDYIGYPEYSQLYGDFKHNVSILDLIFNEGSNANNFLKYR